MSTIRPHPPRLARTPLCAAMGQAHAGTADEGKQQLAELVALSEFAAGVAGPRAWSDLHCMASVAAELARAGIGPEALPLAEASIEALTQGWKVGEPMGMAGLAVLRELQALHCQQRAVASRGELVAAQMLAEARLRGAIL